MNQEPEYMLSEEIADYLAGLGIGTVNEDIWLERLPAGAGQGLFINTIPGQEPEKYLDTMKDGMTFYTRHVDGTVAFKQLKSVMRILNRGQNYDLPHFHVYFSHATGGIGYVTTDANGGMIYSLTMTFIYRDVTIIS